MKLTLAIGVLCAIAGSTIAERTQVVVLGANAISIEKADATITKDFGDKIPVIVAETDDIEALAAALPNGARVAQDVSLKLEQPVVTEEVFSDALPQPPFTQDDDFFFDLQWGATVVGAQEAWNAGFEGQGARVCVLDTGFDMGNKDLKDNINSGLSISFVPGTSTPDFQGSSPFSHGTHVAGIIAAANNGWGVIGVAPKAELVLIKVLDELNDGAGQFSWILEGILYAADHGCKVINMSLGAGCMRQGSGKDSRDVAALRAMLNHAANYAKQKGSLIINSAGNDSLDWGSSNGASCLDIGTLPGVIAVSATQPLGWAVDPVNNVEPQVRASYSNYGTKIIAFAAPGGGVDYQQTAPTNPTCKIAMLTRSCFFFDLVFSTSRGTLFFWAAGTSMAAPHASGVAALIISEMGPLKPAQLKNEMQKRAIDLGKVGRDDIYGFGMVHSGHF